MMMLLLLLPPLCSSALQKRRRITCLIRDDELQNCWSLWFSCRSLLACQCALQLMLVMRRMLMMIIIGTRGRRTDLRAKNSHRKSNCDVMMMT